MDMTDLEGKTVDIYTLIVEKKQTQHAEQEFFEVLLKKGEEKLSSPFFRGIYSKGWNYGHIMPWVDMEFFDEVSFPPKDALVLSRAGIDTEVFRHLGEAMPDGSSIMVAYQMFRKREHVHKITDILLKTGFPAATTPLGLLLVHAGCYSFKDWYIPEGGREGPQKLQGWKPVKKEEKKKKKALLRELKAFLKSEDKKRDFEATARDNASQLVEFLKK